MGISTPRVAYERRDQDGQTSDTFLTSAPCFTELGFDLQRVRASYGLEESLCLLARSWAETPPWPLASRSSVGLSWFQTELLLKKYHHAIQRSDGPLAS